MRSLRLPDDLTSSPPKLHFYRHVQQSFDHFSPRNPTNKYLLGVFNKKNTADNSFAAAASCRKPTHGDSLSKNLFARGNQGRASKIRGELVKQGAVDVFCFFLA